MFNKVIPALATVALIGSPVMAGEVGSSWSSGSSYRNGTGQTIVDSVSTSREAISGALTTSATEMYYGLRVDGGLSADASSYETSNFVPNYREVDGGSSSVSNVTQRGRNGLRTETVVEVENPDQVVRLPGGYRSETSDSRLYVQANDFSVDFTAATSASSFAGTMDRTSQNDTFARSNETYSFGDNTNFGSTSVFAR